MRIVFVGVGSIARKHIKAIHNILPQAEIYALRSSKKSEILSDVKDFFDFEQIKKISPDFIIISNPTSKHIDTIKHLLPLRIPLFIEKPIFSDLGHDDVINEITKKGILTYVACVMRFLDCLRWLRNQGLKEMASHRINEVNCYCGSYLPDWRPNVDFKKCYSAIPELGGGVHIDLIHEIDYLYWIFGKPVEQKSIFRNVSSLGIRAYDYANFNLIYPNFCANVVLNYYRCDSKRYMEILFDDRTWTIDLHKNEIKDERGNIIYHSEQSGVDAFVAQMRYFIDLVKQRAPTSINPASEAYDVLKICLSQT